jgi:protein SCO1/2
MTAALVVCAFAPALSAQPMRPAASGGDGVKPIAPDKVIESVGVDQNLDAQISPDLKFRDETGKVVRLGDYFGKRPLLLSLVYFECPGLCTESLNGISRALKPLNFTPGVEFDVLTISFDPRERPELAAAKKQRYLEIYGRPDAAGGWHFLTGDEADIKELCKTVGFRYAFDDATQQYAHAAAIMVITPQGRVSRYFYGLEYSTKDIRLGVIEASENRIGTLTDVVTLLCYKYDPRSGKYSMQIMYVLRIAAVATVATLGTFMFVMFRRDRRNKLRNTAAAAQ